MWTPEEQARKNREAEEIAERYRLPHGSEPRGAKEKMGVHGIEIARRGIAAAKKALCKKAGAGSIETDKK